MNGRPVVRIEVEQMRHSIMKAFSERQLVRDEMVKEAIERATEPERVTEVIDREVRRVLDKTIRDEVERFFRHSGEGREIIAEAVKEKLLSRDDLVG